MDRQTWMYNISHVEEDYILGVNDFILCALKHQEKKEKELGYKDSIPCPCQICGNMKFFSNVSIVQDHLFRHGFKKNYTKWIWHGEAIDSGGTSGRNKENEGDNYLASLDPIGIPRSRHEGRLEGHGKRRILGIDDVVDEDEYNQFDENPPFSTGLPTTYEDDNFDKHYTRNDHDEGMWID
ncbi:hypothetical protein POM88_048046 [Heracleum sosnowskyi]|uniref:Transposase-associated domain-containing protein n=1 Tax=Heracleum sosnowskyi TaxID=360622 RepID=A0AAD8GVI8_9APIA|nr:hypothetical protein POM88_048046 [Heracleum sosnowskyi]